MVIYIILSNKFLVLSLTFESGRFIENKMINHIAVFSPNNTILMGIRYANKKMTSSPFKLLKVKIYIYIYIVGNPDKIKC